MSIFNTKNTSFSFVSKLILLFLAGTLATPVVVGYFTDHKARASWEKRSLTQFPQWLGWKDITLFFSEIDKFSSDHIGFALPLNRLYRKFRFYVFSDSPATNITVGSSGFVYLNSHNPQKAHTIFQSLCVNGDDNRGLQQRVDTLGEIFSELEARNYRVSLGIAISKPVLYPDYLPLQVPQYYRDACTTYQNRGNIPTRISEIFSTSGRIAYYPLKVFYNYRNQDGFYPKENFHWNGKSAHVFAQEFLSLIGLPPGENFSKDNVLISTKADLHSSGFIRNISTWHYPYTQYKIVKTKEHELDWIKNYYKHANDYSQYETFQPISEERKALVISNSFGVFIAPHLAPGFQSLLHININDLQDNEYLMFWSDFLDKLQPTDIIFIFHDDIIVTGYRLKNISQALVQIGQENKTRKKKSD